MTHPDREALANEIELSDGIVLMFPQGPVQIGIKKTVEVIAALRDSLSRPSNTDRKSVCHPTDPHCQFPNCDCPERAAPTPRETVAGETVQESDGDTVNLPAVARPVTVGAQ